MRKFTLYLQLRFCSCHCDVYLVSRQPWRNFAANCTGNCTAKLLFWKNVWWRALGSENRITSCYDTTAWIACGRLICCITNLRLTTHIAQKHLTVSAVYWKSQGFLKLTVWLLRAAYLSWKPIACISVKESRMGVPIQLRYSLQLPEFRTKISENFVRSKTINICEFERYENALRLFIRLVPDPIAP